MWVLWEGGRRKGSGCHPKIAAMRQVPQKAGRFKAKDPVTTEVTGWVLSTDTEAMPLEVLCSAACTKKAEGS